MAKSSDEASDTSAPRRSLRIPKAAEVLAADIRNRIVSGALKPGELLPSEARLIEEFSLSRPTVREAFRILEAERLITVARGAKGGATIHMPDPGLITEYTLRVLQSERTLVSEIFDARRLIEPPLAREVALHRSGEAAELLRGKLELERAALEDVRSLTAAVADFHRSLVELSGNRPLLHLMDTISQIVQNQQAAVMHVVRRGQSIEEIRASLEVGFRSHAKLISLIASGDGKAAENHWRRHMERTAKTWLTGYEGLTIHSLIVD